MWTLPLLSKKNSYKNVRIVFVKKEEREEREIGPSCIKCWNWTFVYEVLKLDYLMKNGKQIPPVSVCIKCWNWTLFHCTIFYNKPPYSKISLSKNGFCSEFRTMDLLCKTYSNSSDDDDGKQHKPPKTAPPPSKRPKPYFPSAHKPVSQAPDPQIGSPIPQNGRYVSKREKALMASASITQPDFPPTLPPSHGMPFSFFFLVIF